MTTRLKYQPETPWQITADGSLVYNLRQRGWRGGQPAMENDVSFCVNAPKEMRMEFAKLVRDAMNVNYPATNEISVNQKGGAPCKR